MRTRIAVVAACLFLMPRPSAGEVVDRAANGFTVRSEVTVMAGPDASYAALARVAEWWDAAHTWSGSAGNLRLEAKAGGCFCESLPNGGSVEHAVVVYAAPGQMLRVRGSLGPLQATALSGSLTWQFERAGDATKIILTYAVGGYFPGGADALAGPVDGVMSLQLGRLRAFVEAAK